MEIPKDKIEYFSNGRVKSVTHYCNVNNRTLAISVYTHERGRYFADHFDEHHGIDNKGEIPYKNLSADVRRIFNARTRSNVQRLRHQRKIRGFADAN